NNGLGSLRQAILDANATPNVGGPDLINFNIPGAGVQTIRPASTLPLVSDPVTLDATTQPGFNGVPLIEIDGSNVHNPGLWFVAGGSEVRGLVINRFDGPGIQLDGPGGNVIVGNYLGTDATGTAALGNTKSGVAVNSPGNRVGGTTAADRNVISGNGENGVAT